MELNITKSTGNSMNDPYYRYKMPSVKIEYQKFKYVFTNIDSVCKELDREPKLMVSFLKKYLNSTCEYKNNMMATPRAITIDELQHAIYKFIEMYVLCEKCENPETVIETKKKKTYLICKACSHKTEI